ncbi:MAG: HflX family GTPase [Candidatus Poseidoniales archaeon]|nr:MAG: HflX family GTPase [Candidatus Poseidoniales archaeon]
MRMTLGQNMAKQEHFEVLAGAGGVALGEARTNHEGRKAILLVRGDEDTSEFCGLVSTMGIEIIETLTQPGQIDPRGYFGKGRLQDVGDELKTKTPNHPWYGIDLVLIHTNATPRQIVTISDTVQVEVWDRVRLLLSLFTSHANSLEARTQVRIARLLSDRTVLREVANQTTTGERAGFGGGGVTALQAILANVNRELTSLRKRQKKHANAQAERRKQRTRSGAMTVGIAGYTNAGKSSLFLKLSGKEVLVEDKLFSTLETTVGRMAASPRVLLADTIGFIDQLPNSTLDAFRATLAEALECDLLLLLVDSSDDILELERKLSTSKSEIFSRYLGNEEELTSNVLTEKSLLVVLTKVELVDDKSLQEKSEIIKQLGFSQPMTVSSFSERGLAELQDTILMRLFGPPVSLILHPSLTGRAIEGYVSDVYETGLVTVKKENNDGTICIQVWIQSQSLSKLLARSNGRIEVK